MGSVLACLLMTMAVAEPAPANEAPAFLIPSTRSGNSDLFLVDPDKGDAKNITRSEQAEEIYPAWSPDGKRIAFVCKTREHDLEVYVCDADGSNRKRLTTADSPGACFTPSWSADGQSIVYLRMAAKGEVRIVGVDGKNDRLLVAEAVGPAWSPDGRLIAFVRKTAGKPSALCTILASGDLLHTLASHGSPAIRLAAAPDGKHVLSTGQDGAVCIWEILESAY